MLLTSPHPSLLRPHGFISISRPSISPPLPQSGLHGCIYLTRRNTPPLNHKISPQRAPNTFWQDLIYTHHQLEEALSSVTLPSLKPRRPTLSTPLFLHLLLGVRSISCSCWTGCSEFDRPFNGIRPPKIWTNWICCFCGVRTLANTRRAYVQTHFQANMCEQGRLPRWSTFSRNVLWRCEQRALCCVGRKVLQLRNVDSLGISSKWAVQFEQNLRLH